MNIIERYLMNGFHFHFKAATVFFFLLMPDASLILGINWTRKVNITCIFILRVL